MDFKKLSRWELVAIIFCIFVFVFLSLIVVFKSEWLDNIFYSQSYVEEDSSATNEFDGVDYNDVLIPVDVSYVDLEIIGKNGKGSVYLELEEELSLTGLELILEKDEFLEIDGFDCKEPFDCVFYDADEKEFSVFTLVPPTSIELFSEGNLLVGEFIYSGRGNLYLSPNSESFVSTVDQPTFNILNLDSKEFWLE